MEQAKLPNIIILHPVVSCVLCAPGHNIATVAVVAIVHGGAQGAQQRILGQVAALTVRTLDLKWISLKAASPPLNSTIYVVYSDRFMLTPAPVSVDTMQWQCRCVGLYLAARDHFSMTPHPRSVGQLSRAEVMIVSLQLEMPIADYQTQNNCQLLTIKLQLKCRCAQY